MVKKIFSVNGMKCTMCKAKVEKALTGLEGVDSAEVHLDAANVEVSFDETNVTADVLADAVDDAGFELIRE